MYILYIYTYYLLVDIVASTINATILLANIMVRDTEKDTKTSNKIINCPHNNTIILTV